MSIAKIPFSPPDMTQAEATAAANAVFSGWITTGPRVLEFEDKISKYCDTDKTVCLNSATAALELTLRVLGIGEGDEVIVPSYTYTASCSVICHVGATPVMIDATPNSFEMDYDKMADAITEKTKAIIPVDIAGIVCDYEKIYAVLDSKKHLFRPSNSWQAAIGRVCVLSDCAHGFGATLNGKKTGCFGDFTCFSFHAVKNLTTAEGGAVTWKTFDAIDNDELYKEYQVLSLHGQTKSALSKNAPGAWEYDIVGTYYKCNMTDIMAAIGLAQLDRYDSLLDRRHDIIAKYDAAFEKLPVSLLKHTGESHRSSGHLYMVRVNNIDEAKRNEIIMKMAELGVSCNVHYKPLPMMTAYKKLGFDIKDYPNSYELYKNEITLPLYSKLSDSEVDYIISSFSKVLGDLV